VHLTKEPDFLNVRVVLERVKLHWLPVDTVESQFVVEEPKHVRDVNKTTDLSPRINIFINAIGCFLLFDQANRLFIGPSAA
jgi:hypothetical protein